LLWVPFDQVSVARASEIGGKSFRCLHLFFSADVALCIFGFFFLHFFLAVTA